MELVHYSHRPELVMEPRPQAELFPGKWDDKPNGLWVSAGWASWPEAAIGMGFRQNTGFEFAFDIDLQPEARILWIATAVELDGFTKQFLDRRSDRSVIAETLYPGIRWDQVADTYGGIVIAPYIRERRHMWGQWGTSWYYTWDCASGCLWDPAVVRSIRRREGGNLRHKLARSLPQQKRRSRGK